MRWTTEQQAIRDELYEKASRGAMTPDQVELEAERLGVGPLGGCPPNEKYDPMKQQFWSLPMAVAWIAWRSADAVRQYWNAYRTECWDWRESAYRDAETQTTRHGYIVEQRRPASLSLLSIAAAMEDSGHDGTRVMRPGEARDALWIALRTDCFRASGIREADRRVEVPPLEWIELHPVKRSFHGGDDEVAFGAFRTNGYKNVLVASASIVGLWPAAKPKPPRQELPATMSPLGDDYVPLFCAALWIATKGGAVEFDPEETNIWRSAYAELLAGLAAEAIRVVGSRGGERQPVPAYVFADCLVDYPYDDAELTLILSEDLYLRSYPYGGEEAWRRGGDDALVNRTGVKWSRLQVFKPDVVKRWPFGTQQPKAGAPGRPTSMHLVRTELEERASRNELAATVTDEAKALSQWLAATHSDCPPLTAKTIRNNIGGRYRELTRPK